MGDETISPETSKDLASLWIESIEELPESATLAPRFGFNLRLNLGKALAAVGATATAIALVPTAAVLDPISLLKLPAAVFAAVSAAIASVYEKMFPSHYVACIVLAKHPDGLTKDQFETRLREFLDQSKDKPFPWYLGLTADRLKKASEALGTPGERGMDDLIRGLKDKSYIDEKEGRFFYAVRNFKLGLSPE